MPTKNQEQIDQHEQSNQQDISVDLNSLYLETFAQDIQVAENKEEISNDLASLKNETHLEQLLPYIDNIKNNTNNET